jgi:DNA-binding NtrC family response regulator
MVAYDWPGNVRELSNALERTLASMEGDVIGLDDLPFRIHQKRKRGDAPMATASIREAQHRAEIDAIQYALKTCGNNKSRAARMLGIHRTLLYKKIKKYNLSQ